MAVHTTKGILCQHVCNHAHCLGVHVLKQLRIQEIRHAREAIAVDQRCSSLRPVRRSICPLVRLSV